MILAERPATTREDAAGDFELQGVSMPRRSRVIVSRETRPTIGIDPSLRKILALALDQTPEPCRFAAGALALAHRCTSSWRQATARLASFTGCGNACSEIKR